MDIAPQLIQLGTQLSEVAVRNTVTGVWSRIRAVKARRDQEETIRELEQVINDLDEQTRQRAVEPLFTTKTDQAGVGLGLATAHAFATQTGGTLHIESTPDVGTTVTLLLPASADGSAPAP